jgi:precorrin-6A/cobalt-precorrin-6A reductase
MSDGVVLILGGTAEARALANRLHGAALGVITSLAGRVSAPRMPAGDVRIGGFGGPDALAGWLADHGVGAVVDATHPFATRIAASAQAACERTGVPLLRLERAGWTERPGDRWHWVADVDEAAAAVRPGQRVLLAVGRQRLAPFARRDDAWFLIRSIERPSPPLPPHHELLLDRGPFALDAELALIDRHAIDVVVARDSGGAASVAKLDAARARRLPVVIVARPERPPVDAVFDAGAAARWACAQMRP